MSALPVRRREQDSECKSIRRGNVQRCFSLILAPLLLGLGSDDIYYRSQTEADADLARFDRAHPRCELWTNWQRMCSRTGHDGSTHCATDPGRRVRPSKPFCVTASGEGRARPAAGSLTGPEARSLRRFCSPDAASVGPTGIKNEECGFTKSRPFNGYRLAARLHPWCEQWSDAATRHPVCETQNRSAAVPQCSNLAAQGFTSSRGFYCSRPAVPAWCAEAQGLGLTLSTSKGDEIVLIGERQEGFAVRGIHCSGRK